MTLSPVHWVKLTYGGNGESTLISLRQLDKEKDWAAAMTVVCCVTGGNLMKIANRLVQCKGYSGWLKEWMVGLNGCSAYPYGHHCATGQMRYRSPLGTLWLWLYSNRHSVECMLHSPEGGGGSLWIRCRPPLNLLRQPLSRWALIVSRMHCISQVT